MSQSLSRGRSLDVSGYGYDLADLPPLGDRPEDSRFDLRTWFAPERRELPMELEIGSGKGTFLIQQAPLQPGTNFVGIEWAREFWLYAADRMRRHAIPNVRMLHADAVAFVAWRCDDAIFDVVHIYFPDPWPKTKHHKRRSVQEPFLRQLHRVLRPAGEVRLVTDHEDYFAWMLEHADRVSDLFERRAFDPPRGEGEVVGTNFERKYRREGRPFHAMTLKKR